MAQRLPRPSPSRPARRGGFTIVEMMVAVTVLGILAVMALPSMQSLIANERVRGVTTDLMATLMFARSESIKRNAQITVVATYGEWANGWRVETVGAAILRGQDALSGVTATGPLSITYQGNGRVVGATSVQFTFRSSVLNTITMRCLSLDPSGRPNIQLDKDTDTTNGCN